MVQCDCSHFLSCTDVVTAVAIKPPIQAAADGSAPTGIDLVFKLSITTQYNTTVVGDVSYVWDFGDGSGTTETRDTFISHTFLTPKTYSVSLRVVAPYSQADKVAYQLHVYESKAITKTTPTYSKTSKCVSL